LPVFYYLQGWLYPEGSVISKTFLVVYLLISAFYMVKAMMIKDKKSLFFYAWTIMLVLNLIGFLISVDLYEPKFDDHLQMFKNIIGFMLSFYPYYYLTRTYAIQEKHLIVFFLLIIPVFLLQYYMNRENMILEKSYDFEGIVNNLSYAFVGFIPYLFLFGRNRLISGMMAALLMVLIITGAKRGAIISGITGILCYFYYQIREIKLASRIKDIFVYTLIITGIIFIILNAFMSKEFILNRMYSIFEGESSGRFYIYDKIINTWYNSETIFSLIFGFGFGSSLHIAGDFAHNDWLELLSGFGLTGIVANIILFFALIREIVTSKLPQSFRISMLSIASIWLITSMISMWYTSMESFSQSIILGFFIARSDIIKGKVISSN
jgi:O-antigen ligase